jgi:hypothetical protein
MANKALIPVVIGTGFAVTLTVSLVVTKLLAYVRAYARARVCVHHGLPR